MTSVAIALVLSKQNHEPESSNIDGQNTATQTNPDELVYDGNTPVYVTIYSHNEDSWDTKVNTKEKYTEYRQELLNRVNLLADYGIEWDWQSDQPVVQAMVDYEDDAVLKSQTNGKNILAYMRDLGVSIDPHAHTNNYADIVYLIEQLGVDASHVIGGLKFIECGNEFMGFLNFLSWHDDIHLQSDGYIYGEDFSQAKWKPEILSVPGMGGHWFDEFNSGVWRPGDGDDFFTDQGAGNIIYVGKGYPHDTTIIGQTQASGAQVYSSNGQYIKELVDMIKDGELPTGTVDGDKYMYTASLHVRDTDIVDESKGDETVTLDGLKSVLDELKPYQERGEIIFVTYEQVVDIWQNEYNSVPWSIDLSKFKFYKHVIDQAESYCSRPRVR